MSLPTCSNSATPWARSAPTCWSRVGRCSTSGSPPSPAQPCLPAAHNLACYLALRRRDLRPLQQRLAVRGLSSLGRSEAHVLATLDALFALLVSATDPGASDALAFPSRVTFAAGRAAIALEAETLFGLFRKCLS